MGIFRLSEIILSHSSIIEQFAIDMAVKFPALKYYYTLIHNFLLCIVANFMLNVHAYVYKKGSSANQYKLSGLYKYYNWWL